jgi:hypothetical protein
MALTEGQPVEHAPKGVSSGAERDSSLQPDTGSESDRRAELQGKAGSHKKIVRSFTATLRELRMLEALARYHGFSKSATITNLLKKEFWRIFPGGTDEIQPEPGARIAGKGS